MVKLVPLIVIIIFGFIKGNGNPIFEPIVGPGASVAGSLGQVLIATLFAYDGWINVGAIAGEMKEPGKDLPKAIVGGISIVMAVYIVIKLSISMGSTSFRISASYSTSCTCCRKNFW